LGYVQTLRRNGLYDSHRLTKTEDGAQLRHLFFVFTQKNHRFVIFSSPTNCEKK